VPLDDSYILKLHLSQNLQLLHYALHLCGTPWKFSYPPPFPVLHKLQLSACPECITRILNALPLNTLEPLFRLYNRSWSDAIAAPHLRGIFTDWWRCFIAIARHTSLTNIIFTIQTGDRPEGIVYGCHDDGLIAVFERLLTVQRI
jgi:hypothetical protein